MLGFWRVYGYWVLGPLGLRAEDVALSASGLGVEVLALFRGLRNPFETRLFFEF